MGAHEKSSGKGKDESKGGAASVASVAMGHEAERKEDISDGRMPPHTVLKAFVWSGERDLVQEHVFTVSLLRAPGSPVTDAAVTESAHGTETAHLAESTGARRKSSVPLRVRRLSRGPPPASSDAVAGSVSPPVKLRIPPIMANTTTPSQKSGAPPHVIPLRSFLDCLKGLDMICADYQSLAHSSQGGATPQRGSPAEKERLLKTMRRNTLQDKHKVAERADSASGAEEEAREKRKNTDESQEANDDKDGSECSQLIPKRRFVHLIEAIPILSTEIFRSVYGDLRRASCDLPLPFSQKKIAEAITKEKHMKESLNPFFSIDVAGYASSLPSDGGSGGSLDLDDSENSFGNSGDSLLYSTGASSAHFSPSVSSRGNAGSARGDDGEKWIDLYSMRAASRIVLEHHVEQLVQSETSQVRCEKLEALGIAYKDVWAVLCKLHSTYGKGDNSFALPGAVTKTPKTGESYNLADPFLVLAVRAWRQTPDGSISMASLEARRRDLLGMCWQEIRHRSRTKELGAVFKNQSMSLTDINTCLGTGNVSVVWAYLIRVSGCEAESSEDNYNSPGDYVDARSRHTALHVACQ